MSIWGAIKSLVSYGVDHKLIEKEDQVYITNSICQALQLEAYEDTDEPIITDLESILKEILDYATAEGLCEDSIVYRDLFDTKIMGILTPRPSQVIKEFFRLYAQSPKAATDYYYALSKDTDYIRQYRIKNDLKWVTKTEYGDIDITINLSKPEKDPKAIAAALKMKQSAYPKCQLCRENEGYMGKVNHPARQNHRIIPITLDDTDFYLQYSPYVYYNEHCIVFNAEHIPMKIDKSTIQKLLDFLELFPHYFIGSNAGLPIVGGSILTHEHFQGGNYQFAMAKAEIETPFVFPGYEDITAGIVKWPMSVVRLAGEDKSRVVDLAGIVMNAWSGYTDEEAFVLGETDGEPHNAITPITRMRDGRYEVDLVLRNNITTPDHPMGYYHPHPEHHHIKQENIGLIEVMGLAVLPSRLKAEMSLLADAMVSGADIENDEILGKHYQWAEMIKAKYNITKENIDGILKDEIGLVFTEILEQCGVFDRTDAGKAQFVKFLESVK